MKVVAVYTWARDVAGAVVHGDGTVQWRTTKTAPGEDDHAVLTAARAVAEAAGGEVVGLMLGDGDASWALARGIASATRVDAGPDITADADEAATAAVLARAVERIGDVDVVLIADSEEHPLVGVALAAQLGWPVLTGVLSARAEDGRVLAVRRGDVEETLAAAPPVVLTVAAEGLEPRAPGMKEMLAARKRPVTTVTLADLGLEPPVAAVSTRATRVPEVTGARMFEGDPATAARALVAALRSEGVI